MKWKIETITGGETPGAHWPSVDAFPSVERLK